MDSRKTLAWATVGGFLVTLFQVLAGVGTTVGQDQPLHWNAWFTGATVAAVATVALICWLLFGGHRAKPAMGSDLHEHREPIPQGERVTRETTERTVEDQIHLGQASETGIVLPVTVLEESPNKLSVVGPEFQITIEEQVWRRFINTRPMVLGLQLKLRITNLTQHEKHTTGAGIQAVNALMAEAVTDTHVEEPYKAWLHSKPRGIQGAIDPEDSVAGWFAYTFKHRPSGGTPAYTLMVHDELGNAYVIEVPERGPETYQ